MKTWLLRKHNMWKLIIQFELQNYDDSVACSIDAKYEDLFARIFK